MPGRYALPPQRGPRAADLVLAGRPLPLTGTLRVWTCGITPYDVTHLGHAATFLWTDLLLSVAERLGVKTISSRNVTDIDDVLTAAADRGGRRYDELAVTQEFAFDQDMAALGVARPDLSPRARAHVPEMIQFIEALLTLDRAYLRDGNVFFRAPSDLDRPADAASAFAEFGDADSGAGREGEWDVLVWKASGEDDPAWPSPWGWGRPGWHVECAAMAASAFGNSVDVLAGGADLAFPHHTFQAAMASAVSGCRFARSQMHVGTVNYQGSKMAKSTGNLVLVSNLLAEHSGAALRMLVLNRAWAEPWEYVAADLGAAAALVEELHTAAGRAIGPTSSAEAATEAMLTALVRDLDVPAALALALESGGTAARVLADVLKV